MSITGKFSRPISCALIISAFLVSPAVASQVAEICDSAAEVAAREQGVPIEVMRAIAFTETGRQIDGAFEPWPWTVNMEGVGKWFNDVTSARQFVNQNFERGARSFDVGCFQINFLWHGEAFESIEHMFEPLSNARYAAKFLSELYLEFGDWSRAAGAYHSRTPKYAKKYRERFDRILANLPVRLPDQDRIYNDGPPTQFPKADLSPPRVNRFPLLRPGGTVLPGSLVPLGTAQTTRLFDLKSTTPILGGMR